LKRGCKRPTERRVQQLTTKGEGHSAIKTKPQKVGPEVLKKENDLQDRGADEAPQSSEFKEKGGSGGEDLEPQGVRHPKPRGVKKETRQKKSRAQQGPRVKGVLVCRLINGHRDWGAFRGERRKGIQA